MGDVVRLRKQHPCGGSDWEVTRLGADIGLRCLTCKRYVLIERGAAQRSIRLFVTRGAPIDPEQERLIFDRSG
jgi:hypothetical protein